MALDEGDGTGDDHRKCLDKDDSPQAVEGGNEQENQHPCDVDFGKIHGANQGAAPPHGRQKCSQVEKADHDQEEFRLLGQILQCAFGSTQGGEQTPHGQDGGDLGEREKFETGNPVFRAGAIDHEETAEPEEGVLGRVRGPEGYAPSTDFRRYSIVVAIAVAGIADGHKFLFFSLSFLFR